MKRYLEESAGDPISEFEKASLAHLAEQYFPDKNARIMDIGPAHGKTLLFLKELGYTNLCAADVDPTYEEFFKANGISFAEIDITAAQFLFPADSFDVVICSHIFEHLPEPFHALGEIHRILKKGGVLFIMVPDWQKHFREFYNDPTHIHPYTKQGLARALERAEFESITVKSHGCFRGLGRIRAWQFWKGALFTGEHIIAIANK